jgi:ferritin
MMCKYLLDSGVSPRLAGVPEPRVEFGELAEPLKLALDQERKVTEQISALTKIAREESDFVSEQFTYWFLKEQVEEVDLFSSLLDVAELCRDRPFDLEDYIAREGVGGGKTQDPTAPPVAGVAPGD